MAYPLAVSPRKRPVVVDRPSWHPQIVAALIVVGFMLRTRAYLARDPLFVDEAASAASLITRSLGGLLSPPLEYGQMAAPGFLILQKLGIMAFGNGELALRLVPFLASIAAVVLMVRLAGQVLPRSYVPAAVAVFALSTPQIYYAAFAKPYAVDVLLTILLLSVALKWSGAIRTPADSLRLTLAGVIAPWFSIPSALVVGSIGLVLLAYHRHRVSRIVLGWAVSAGLAVLVAKTYERDPLYLASYWQPGFLPRTSDVGMWLVHTGLQTLYSPLGVLNLYFGGVTLTRADVLAFVILGLVVVTGAVVLVRLLLRRDRAVAVLAAPVLAVLGASALRMYPFGGPEPSSGRMILFLGPSILLLVMIGLVALATQRAWVGVVGASVLIAGAIELHFVGTPINVRQDLPAVLREVRSDWRSGDELYVYYGARAAFEYYGRNFPQDRVRYGVCAKLDPPKYLADLDQLRPNLSVWFVFAHKAPGFSVADEAYFTHYLDAIGTRMAEIEAGGVSAYHYALTAPGVAPRMPPLAAPVPTMSPLDRAKFTCVGPVDRDGGERRLRRQGSPRAARPPPQRPRSADNQR